MGAWARTARPALPGRGAAHRVQACLHPSLPPAAVWHCVASSAPGRMARSPFPLLVNSSVQLKKHKAFFPMTTLGEKGQKCLGIMKEKDSHLNPFPPNIFSVINESYRPKALHIHTKLSMVNANLAASRALFYYTGVCTHQHLQVSLTVSSAAIYPPVLFKISKCGNLTGRGGQAYVHF